MVQEAVGVPVVEATVVEPAMAALFAPLAVALGKAVCVTAKAWPRDIDKYHSGSKHEAVNALSKLDDGSLVPCRGRNRPSDAWDYGYLLKRGEQVEICYQSGDREANRLEYFLYGQLVQIATHCTRPPTA